MINVNQLTEQLRMLPDAILQRVAQMYKQDPYILPLVVSEGMARKKMRMAGQARAAAPQPKVNDQAVASLGYTPEEVGIGALQAPNMQSMADGGIAGQADEMEFAQRSEPVVRMSGGGVPGYADKGAVRLNPYIENILALDPDFNEDGTPRTRRESARIREKQAEAREQRQKDIAYAGQISATVPTAAQERMEAYYRPRRTPEQLAGGPIASTPTPVRGEPLQEPPMINPETGMPYTLAAPALPAAAAEPSPELRQTSPIRGTNVGAGSAAPTGTGMAPSGVPGASAPSAPASRTPSIYDLTNPEVARSMAGTLMPTNRYETAFNVQQQREIEREQAREAERERAKPTGKAKEGLEALLQQEAKGTEKEMSDAGAFALIRAGLAIASGSSPNALKNIADGLNVGAQEYQAAIKDLKKADRERKLILADIQEARRLEERGDYDRAQDRKDRAADRETARERYTMSGIMQLGISQDQLAGSLFGKGVEASLRRDLENQQQAGAMARTVYSGDIQLQIARIQAAARNDPQSKEGLAMARVQQAINGSPMLKELANKAALNLPGAAEKYRAEEEALYLKLAPELLFGAGAAAGTTGGASPTRSAADAILQQSR